MSFVGIISASFFSEALQPLQLPDKLGKPRIVALTNWALIGFTIIASVIALWSAFVGKWFYMILASLGGMSGLIGAYAIKRVLLDDQVASLEYRTETLYQQLHQARHHERVVSRAIDALHRQQQQERLEHSHLKLYVEELRQTTQQQQAILQNVQQTNTRLTEQRKNLEMVFDQLPTFTSCQKEIEERLQSDRVDFIRERELWVREKMLLEQHIERVERENQTLQLQQEMLQIHANNWQTTSRTIQREGTQQESMLSDFVKEIDTYTQLTDRLASSRVRWEHIGSNIKLQVQKLEQKRDEIEKAAVDLRALIGRVVPLKEGLKDWVTL